MLPILPNFGDVEPEPKTVGVRTEAPKPTTESHKADFRHCKSHVRQNLVGGIVSIVFGLLLFLMAVAAWAEHQGWQAAGALLGGLVISVLGVSLLNTWARQHNDRSPQLSLTSQGLWDHRTGRLIHWQTIRGSRLTVTTSKGATTNATLYVTVGHTFEPAEVGIDVLGLDCSPEEIARLVQERIVKGHDAGQQENTGRE